MRERVHPKTGIWKLLPWVDTTAQAIGNHIFVPERFYQNYLQDTLSLDEKSVLVHEQTHLDRQAKYGLLPWLVLYLVDPSFRYHEELEALSAQIVYLVEHDQTPPIEQYAQNLSSWLYLRMVTYEQALADLNCITP